MSIVEESRNQLVVGTEIIRQRMTKVGDSRLGDQTVVDVAPSSLFDLVSQRLSMLIDLRLGKIVPESQIVSYLKTLLVYRIKQLSGKCPVKSQDVYVPSFFYPVLAALGKFEDPSRALRVTMGISDEPQMTPVEMSRFGFMLSSAGVKVELGLPKLLMVDSDDIYRVKREDNELFVAGSDVGEFTLLVRTLIDVEFQVELFGAPRTRYLSIQDATSAWEAIVGLAVS